jgi:hypothetical protein
MATGLIIKSAAIASSGAGAAPGGGAELAARNRSMESADFSRLMSQAQEEQARVELANPAHSMAHQSLGGVTKAVSESSQKYRNATDAGLESLSKADFKDPASVADVIQHFTVAAAQGMELTIMLGEVSTSKRSVSELFHNQG